MRYIISEELRQNYLRLEQFINPMLREGILFRPTIQDIKNKLNVFLK